MLQKTTMLISYITRLHLLMMKKKIDFEMLARLDKCKLVN